METKRRRDDELGASDHDVSSRSMTSSDHQEASCLPVEMWVHVMQFVYPPPTKNGDGPSRRRLSSAFRELVSSVALVCRLWRAMAMSLVKTITVRMPDGYYEDTTYEALDKAEDILAIDRQRVNTFIGALRSVAAHCTSLEELRVDGCGLNMQNESHEDLLANLPSHPSLRRLTLENLTLRDDHFSHISASMLRRLEYLNISFCRHFPGDSLSIIRAKLCESGKGGRLDTPAEANRQNKRKKSSYELVEKGAAHKQRQATVRTASSVQGELSAGRSSAAEEMEEVRMLEGARLLEEEPEYNLRELVVRLAPKLRSLQDLPLRLERLSLQSCYCLNDSQMKYIARLPHLKFLLLSINRQITDTGLSMLPLESLKEFHFHYWGMGVTTPGIRDILNRSEKPCIDSRCRLLYSSSQSLA